MDQFTNSAELLSSDPRPVAEISIPPWKPNNHYIKDAPIISPVDGSLCIAKANFASGAVFNAANWTVIAAYSGGALDPRYDTAGAAAGLAIVFGA